MTTITTTHLDRDLTDVCMDHAHGLARTAIRVGDWLTAWGRRSARRSLDDLVRLAALEQAIDAQRARHPLTW